MIDLLTFSIILVIYIAFCVVTIDVYTKREEIHNLFVIPTFYLFYTILAAYVIYFVDVSGTGIEKGIQTGIYSLACGIILTYYYKDKVKADEKSKISY